MKDKLVNMIVKVMPRDGYNFTDCKRNTCMIKLLDVLGVNIYEVNAKLISK